MSFAVTTKLICDFVFTYAKALVFSCSGLIATFLIFAQNIHCGRGGSNEYSHSIFGSKNKKPLLCSFYA